MIYFNLLEELVIYVEKGKNVFFFIVDWCGDCCFIKLVMFEIEEVFLVF